MDESCIVYESGPFFAVKLRSGGVEIRKNVFCYSVVLGVAKDTEQAIRFINRACKYPDKF